MNARCAARSLSISTLLITLLLLPSTGLAQAPEPSMVLIPEGNFVMGGNTNVGLLPVNPDEKPQHTVQVSAFYMDAYEVYQNLWNWVTNHNNGNGYTYSNAISAKGNLHPIHTISWFDAVKWCNARSERDGLRPVYYTDASFRTIYKSGKLVPYVNWHANGYRLPTEAEWEKAGRGGVADTRFPWTDYTNRISHAKANYTGGMIVEPYDLSMGYHPAYDNDPEPYTSPVGDFSPNGYGLYGVIGNVFEWCWDWYLTNYYALSPATDPRGPTSGVKRILRSGSWLDGAYDTASRMEAVPEGEDYDIGFRCAARRVESVGDYSGNGQSDFPVFNPGDGSWYISSTNRDIVTWTNQWGWSTVKPVPGDYDGDGLWDLAVFDPAGGNWYIKRVNRSIIAGPLQWGWSTVKPVPGDYDGDGRYDLAVFDSAGGNWYIRRVDGSIIASPIQWGWSTVKPVPGDYDGDGVWDLAVFDPAGGNWYIKRLNGSIIAGPVQWGWSTVKPVSGDYDGDGKYDLAVFDTATGNWYIRRVDGTIIASPIQWGWSTAKPVPGDYDGDGRFDLAVYDTAAGYWYVKTVANQIRVWQAQWGWPGATIPTLEAGP